MLLPRPRPRSAAAGFTLAEVAVTIAIVAISLTLSMQVLNGASLTAAHTRQQRVARELGLFTMGQIESGMYWDEIGRGFTGSYADLDQPEFYFEVVLGDEGFLDDNIYDRDKPFDNFAYQREREYDDEDFDEDAAQPFEKVKVRVTHPRLGGFTNTIDLERWVPWAQVYGPEEGEETAAPSETPSETPSGGEVDD